MWRYKRIMTKKIKGNKVQHYLGLAFLESLEPEKALAAFEAGNCDIPKTEFASCGDRCFKNGLTEKAKKAYEIAGIDEKERYAQLANELLDKGSVIKALKCFAISETDPPEEKLHSYLQDLMKKGFYWDEIRAIYGIIKNNLSESEKKDLRGLCMRYLHSPRRKDEDAAVMILKNIGNKEEMLLYANGLVARNSIKKAKKIFEIIVQLES